MARLRRSGIRVHRPIFRRNVRLNPGRIRDVRGRGRIRGSAVRSTAHKRVHR